MKRILLSQPGRRFVYSALVSEAKYELIMLDERGTLRSQAFDYNKNSHDLVHLILLLTGVTPGLDGFHKDLSRDATGLQLACGDHKFHIELPVASSDDVWALH
ncbi:hypothetical protein PQX77_013846 [Marasmius sp. AFHP31]|nr:hypothetical protein PQX77_013846 [Marasmius sp. AFHP31]